MSLLTHFASRRVGRPALAPVMFGLAALGLLALAPSASAQYYTAVNLTSLGYPSTVYDSRGTINDAGQFADDNILTGPNGLGPITDIGTLNGQSVKAYSVNDTGQISGTYRTADNYIHAFISGPSGTGPLEDLGTLGGNYTYVGGINASGQVTGGSTTNSNYEHAFLSDPKNGNALKDLGVLSGAISSEGVAVNASGQVAGICQLSNLSSAIHAFISGPNGGPLKDLGTLGGDNSYSFARAINASGQVVGLSNDATGRSHAYLSGSNGGPLKDLGTLLGPLGNSDAESINDAGTVVGGSQVFSPGNSTDHAFIYSNGLMTDLNSLVSSPHGVILNNAFQITNSGYILATSSGGFDRYGNPFDAIFLLRPTSVPPPVPEASSSISFGLLLMLAGLVMVARRKKARAAV